VGSLSYFIVQSVSARRAPPRGDGGRELHRYPIKWITAFMPSWQAQVGTKLRDRVSETQNRRLIRVRKGSQSSPNDRSSILVDNLAKIEFNATRKQPKNVSQSHDCHANHDIFCYICSKFEVKSLRKTIDDDICNMYDVCMRKFFI